MRNALFYSSPKGALTLLRGRVQVGLAANFGRDFVWRNLKLTLNYLISKNTIGNKLLKFDTEAI